MNAVYPKIEAATAYSDGKYIGPDIVKMLISGHMQLWGIVDDEDGNLNGITITEIATYPQRKVCRMLSTAGEGSDNMLPLLPEVESWAKACGCSSIEPVCRPGWEKILKPYGYKKTHILLSKELSA